MARRRKDPSLPAILGGPPAVTATAAERAAAERWPQVTAEDEAAVLEVLRSGRLSIHEVVAELEEEWRRRLGARHCLAHNNGTAAILAGLHALGVGPGDEVLVPSGTFWASVTPVLHCGGVPVFVESEDRCLGLDPEDLDRKATPRAKAVIVVHIFGIPSRMDEILVVARRRGLRVLEDASHAHGAVYHGRPVGTLGDAAVFSLQASKLLPSSEGGLLVTDDDGVHARALRLGHYERLLDAPGPDRRFAATGFGLKHRMSPLSAALARSQLRRLDERTARRTANCVRLSRRLQPLGFETFLAPKDVERVYFEFLVRHDESRIPMDALTGALRAEGAEAGPPRYPLLHQQPLFTEGHWAKVARLEPKKGRPLRTYDPADLPRTTVSNAAMLKLPAFPNATEDLLEQYARAFEKVMAHADRISREPATPAGARGR